MQLKSKILIGLFCTAAFLLGAQENMLKNGDFSQIQPDGKRPANWSGRLNETSGIRKGIAPGKKNAICFDHTGHMLSQTVKVEPGKVYQIRYWLKNDFSKWLSAASMQILWMDAKGKHLFVDYKGKKVWNMKIKNLQGSRDWQLVEMPECVAPAGAYRAQIRMGIVFDKDGSCYFADINMSEVKKGNAFENRMASIPFVAEKISFTDIFNRKYWNNAAVLNDFIVPATNSRAKFLTSAEVFYTKEAIYYNIKCSLPNASQQKMDDRRSYDMQESCEVFLRPDGYKHQYQFFISPNGKVRCLSETWGDGSWPLKTTPLKEPNVLSKVEKLKDSWRVALRIPFRALDIKGTPAVGRQWQMNVCRAHYGEKNYRELSAWSALRNAHFQFPGDFGKVIFGAKDVPLIKNIRIDANGAQVQIRNNSAKERKLTAVFVKHTKTGAWETFRTEFSVAANQSRDFSLQFSTKDAAMRFLELREKDQLIAKHCNMPSDKYYSMGIFDPEGVRGKTWHIAMDRPFFLGLNMIHNAPGLTTHRLTNRDKKPFDMILEVPEQLKFNGMIFDAGEWRQSPYIKPTVTPFKQDGRKMLRYKFELPLVIHWPSPVYIFFYECKMPENTEFSGAYYLIEDGVALPRHELSFKTVKMGNVSRMPKLFGHDMFYMDAKIIKHLFPKDTLKHYTALGFNRITVNVQPGRNNGFYSGNAPKKTEDYYDLLFREMEKTGIRLYYTSNSSSATPQAWSWTHKDKDARAIGANGKDAPYNQYGYPSLCPNYRGKFFQKHVEKLTNSYLFRKYKCTWLTLDLELWPKTVWEKLCFCNRCLKDFAEYAKQKKLTAYVSCDVRKLFRAKDKEFLKVWNEYKNHCHTRFIRDLTDPVRKLTVNYKSSAPQDRFLIGEWCKPREHLLDTIDFFEMGLYYTPDVVYTHYEKVYKQFGDRKKNFYPTHTFGQTDGCPDFHMKAHQLTELIYEAAIYGAQGICWYYYPYLEPLRMKYIIQALNVILPFENLIVKGDIVKDITIDNTAMQLTARRNGNEGLIAVRAYKANTAQKGKITFAGLKQKTAVYDCITRKKLADLSPDCNSFEYTVDANRCRLLYFGTDAQWKQRK